MSEGQRQSDLWKLQRFLSALTDQERREAALADLEATCRRRLGATARDRPLESASPWLRMLAAIQAERLRVADANIRRLVRSPGS